MPSETSLATPPIPDPSLVSAMAMAQAELSGAASIALVMFNAAQAEQACQQIELTSVGVTCAMIVVAAAL